MPMKYLIVGFGNIGDKYHETRHNIGFMVVDKFAQKNDISYSQDRYGKIAEYKLKGRQLYFLKPDTFMNLSGSAVRYWMQKLKIEKENILIITDDLALPPGKIRLKSKGSDGGHNGLKSIQELIQSNEYPRLRFGIGSNFPKGQQADYVLQKFSLEETNVISESIDKSVELIESFCTIGIERTMNKFN